MVGSEETLKKRQHLKMTICQMIEKIINITIKKGINERHVYGLLSQYFLSKVIHV